MKATFDLVFEQNMLVIYPCEARGKEKTRPWIELAKN